MLTLAQRQTIASDIIAAMKVHYREVGEDGDFEDGYRYLAHDADEEELAYEHNKWCKPDPCVL